MGFFISRSVPGSFAAMRPPSCRHCGLWHPRRPMVLHDGDVAACRPLLLLADQIGQRDRLQERKDVVVQARPQLVRHAPAVVRSTVFLAAALSCVDRLIDGGDDVGHGYGFERTREVIAAARTADALDQAMPAELAEQLLEIGQGDLLALGYAGEGDRTGVAVQCNV